MAVTVHDYFQAALRQPAAPDARACGQVVQDGEGNSASFLLAVRMGRIEQAQFRCTTCVTLVALCEHLRQVVCGQSVAAAWRVTAADLLAWHPEVPRSRRDRAELAVRALHAAIESVAGDSL